MKMSKNVSDEKKSQAEELIADIERALAGANAVVVYATGAIVGDAFAPSPLH